MAGTPLEELFVQFSTKDQDKLKAAIDEIHKSALGLASGLDAFGKIMSDKFGEGKRQTDSLGKSFSDLRANVDAFGASASNALGKATGLLGGFVFAGIRASSTGQLLGFEMERLSRTVAGLFSPEINKAIDLIGRFSDYLGNLSDRQRENLAHWIEGGAAALGFVAIVPRILNGISGLTRGFGSLVSGAMGLATAFGSWLSPLVLVAEALAALMLGTSVADHGFQGLLDTMRPLFDFVMELAGALSDGLAPVFDALRDLIDALGPVIDALGKALAGLGRLIVSAVTPVLQAIAAVIRGIAESVAYLTGVDLEKARAERGENRAAARTDRGQLARRVGGIESIDQTYKRIAQASSQFGGRPVAEKQLEEEKFIRIAVEKMAKFWEQARPVFAR